MIITNTKIKSFIITIICVLLISSCSSQSELSTAASNLNGNIPSINSTPTNKITLPFDPKDGLNPYTVKTRINQQLIPLVFDSLYKIDENFNARPVLAETAYTVDNKVTITLKKAMFTDTTPVTAADVVYSFNLAKTTDNYYAQSLTNITEMTAINDTSVQLILEHPDKFYAATLYYPIIKKDSNKLDNSVRGNVPIGSGRYILVSENNMFYLNENINWYGEDIYRKIINLIDTPDLETLKYYISTKSVSIHYQDSYDNTIVSPYTLKSAVNTSKLMLMGINPESDNPFLQNDRARQIINSIIDRTELVSSNPNVIADNNIKYSIEANGPYSPQFDPALGLQTLSPTADTQKAIADLSALGYNEIGENGYTKKDGQELTLELLTVNNSTQIAVANQLVKQFDAVNIKLNVTSLEYDEYLGKLYSGDFDLFLGDIDVEANFNFLPLLTTDGNAAFSLDKSIYSDENTSQFVPAGQIYVDFLSGSATINDFLLAFEDELPFIPLSYHSAVLFYANDITTSPISTSQDIYYNLHKI